MISVLNNIASLTAQNNLSNTSNMLSATLQKLSSGQKINSGADGPAALVISEEQQSQIAGLKTAIDNTSKSASLVQTAEGAMNEINNLLTQARSLALDSANSATQDANSFAANQSQLANILTTITAIATRTQFGTKNLLDGSSQTGALTTSAAGVSTSGLLSTPAVQASYSFSVTTAAQQAQAVGAAGFAGAGGTLGAGNAGTLSINGVNIALGTGDTIGTTVNAINTALTAANVNIQASNVGGQLTLTSTDFATNINLAGTTAATRTALGLAAGPFNHVNGVLQYTNSSGNPVNVTGAGNVFTLTGELAGVTVTLGASSAPGSISSVAPANGTFTAGSGLNFQIGANAGQTASLTIGRVAADSLGTGASQTFANLGTIRIDTAANAQEALKVIDQATSNVSNLRGNLGAFQAETLQSTSNNLQATLQNTTAAESVIRDTNFAQETSNYTKYQVLMQVGTTVLANANQTTQLILGLFKGQ